MDFSTIGFIGVGTMGCPMSHNLAMKSGCRILAYDVNPQALARPDSACFCVG